MKFKARPDIEANPPVLVNLDVCDLCGACLGICPPDCIVIDRLSLKIIGEDCINCGFCIATCPIEALRWNEDIKSVKVEEHA